MNARQHINLKLPHEVLRAEVASEDDITFLKYKLFYWSITEEFARGGAFALPPGGSSSKALLVSALCAETSD